MSRRGKRRMRRESFAQRKQRWRPAQKKTPFRFPIEQIPLMLAIPLVLGMLYASHLMWEGEIKMLSTKLGILFAFIAAAIGLVIWSDRLFIRSLRWDREERES